MVKKRVILLAALLLSCNKAPEKKIEPVVEKPKPRFTVSVEQDSMLTRQKNVLVADSARELKLELNFDTTKREVWIQPRFSPYDKQTFEIVKAYYTPAFQKAFELIPSEYKLSLISGSYEYYFSPSWCVPVAVASVSNEDYIDFRKNYPNSKYKYTNKIFVDMANETEAYAPLQELFNDMGYRISIRSVEKVFSQKVEELEFRDALIEKGLKPSDRVIYDAGMIYYSMEKIEE